VRTTPVVELQGVSRTFDRDTPVHALRQVDLSIWPGEWVAVVGPSGSGKSTLLNVLGLLDRPTSGTYLFNGVDVNGLDDLARAGLRGREIGFIFQAFHLLPHRSVLENVMLAELYMGASRRGRQQRARAALERVGLGDRADFLPTRLSGGERQRAAIARALMGEPGLLLCDEPTGNLDSKSAANVLDILGDLSRDGLTLVVITHDEHVAGRADRRVRIIDGQLGEISPAPGLFPTARAGAGPQ
jgi:ABC-type lipoprotein export system ATPase subunit